MEVIFGWNGWLIGLIVMVVVNVLLARYAIPFMLGEAHQYKQRSQSTRRAQWIIPIVLFLIINFSGALSGMVATSSTSVKVNDAAQSLGLTSGKEYPFEVGSLSIGVAGTIQGGFLGFDGQVQSASTLKVGFTSETGNSYLLEIPTSVMTFRQVPGTQPSMILNLKDEFFQEPRYTKADYSPCHWTLNNLWLVCKKELKPGTPTIPKDIIDSGLAPLVSKYILGATITLTPEMYQELLNG